ncbi:BnaUnng02190D [Brassica napus]|uniref:BnaUnng02190D protein n=1 Tax=Brassica napus TaxID=3708 RepID=A0A078JLZ5_BRANA|nr:BnaUnng02190D [Brassica napus]
MKHIYPEAIEVKRVLKCDEVTSCMKPTLHINLNTDAIELEDTSCATKYMQLRKVFYSKLVEFYKAHPKDEIPKELLPEPVNPSQSFPSRRCITMTLDDDSDSVRPTNDLERRPSRTRCLNFDTLEEEDGTVSDKSNDEANDDEASDASYDEISLLDSMIEEPKAETVKQNLPKLVDVIHKLFRSTNKTVITKEELLHKMIACQIDIMNRKEVEEQLRLMLQLVPDWISGTKASFGDVLVSINKMSTPETVRARLEEATSQDTSTTPDK